MAQRVIHWISGSLCVWGMVFGLALGHTQAPIAFDTDAGQSISLSSDPGGSGGGGG
jgi:hypothetical protein